jgi:hypothetical protein
MSQMTTKLSNSDKSKIEWAKSYLDFWRYWRWIQIAIGLVIIGSGFHVILSASGSSLPLMFGILHPAVVVGLGSATLGDAVWEKRAKDRRLILKLAERHETGVH